MARLILFDIDGTLTRTEDGYLPFNEALRQTFGVAADIRTVVPDGNTDPLIVKEIFAKANIEIAISADDWRCFTADLQKCYREHVECGLTRVRALPGARQLLCELGRDPSFSASIVTGNFEVTAEVKLHAAGLAPYLSRGAYASDSAHRPDLPAVAKRRWENLHGRAIDSAQCVIVGDTPNDLDAARQNGMKCVLVGTGRYPVEELEYCLPDGCVADLSDTEAVLAALANL